MSRIVFSNGALLSVFKEQPFVLGSAGLFIDLHGMPLPLLAECKPVHHRKPCLATKIWSIQTSYPSKSLQYGHTQILGSLHWTNFPYHSQVSPCTLNLHTQPDPSCSLSYLLPVIVQNLIPLPRENHLSLLEVSFLLNFSGSVGCSLISICLTDNIHL